MLHGKITLDNGQEADFCLEDDLQVLLEKRIEKKNQDRRAQGRKDLDIAHEIASMLMREK
jgi:hypothetical protein